MEFFLRLLLGLIGTGIGYLLIKYAHQIHATFGEIPSAEQYLRFFGGTRLVIKLIGLVIIFLAFLYIFALGPFK